MMRFALGKEVEVSRPFYVSDVVLKPALIGLAHQCIDQSELPEALAPAIAALHEQILDPLDYAWSLIGLVFSYEAGYVDCPVNSINAADMAVYRLAVEQKAQKAKESNETVDSAADSTVGTVSEVEQIVASVQQHQVPLPVPICPPAPAGQRYLPTELMLALERQNNNLVTWMAILARLYGTGLKVPPEHAIAFIRTWWCRRGRYLPAGVNSLYKCVPAAFLSVQAYYLGQYVASVPFAFIWLRLTLGRMSLESLVQSKQCSVAGRRLSDFLGEQLVCSWGGNIGNIEEVDATSLLESYQYGYLLDVLEELDVQVSGAQISWAWDKLFDNLGVYWRQMWTHFYLKGEQVSVVTTGEAGVQITSADHKQLSSRLVSWLLRAANSARSKKVRTDADALLRLVPGAQWEQEVVALVRRFLVVTKEQGEIHCSWHEFTKADAKLGRKLLRAGAPNINHPSYELHCLKHHGDKMPPNLLFSELTWYVPPALWFEIFQLERTGDEVQDAERLFTHFARSFPGWTLVTFYYGAFHGAWARSKPGVDCVLYFIARVGCELGAVYSDAFYRHCGSLLYNYDDHAPNIAVGLFAQVGNDEREQLPFVVAPERYQELLAPLRDLSTALYYLAPSCVLDSDVCWGPKFSQFYWQLLAGLFEPKALDDATKHIRVSSLYKHLNIVAWMLDPQVRAVAIAQLKKHLSTMQVDFSQEDSCAIEDDAFQGTVQQRMCLCLKQLLDYMEDAERVQHLCAQLQAQYGSDHK